LDGGTSLDQNYKLNRLPVLLTYFHPIHIMSQALMKCKLTNLGVSPNIVIVIVIVWAAVTDVTQVNVTTT
jgi:hypothetical protein